MTLAALLTLTNVVKRYGDADGAFRLGPVQLALAPGETIAVMGPNGAGKTTLFELLTGNLDATEGEISLEGKKLTPDKPELKRRIGYLPQHHALPRWVTGREILSYAARLHELPDPQKRVAGAEAYWDCASYAHKPLAALSYGMQKRVALALASLSEPPLLVLDEPFDGLDLLHVRALEDAIRTRGQRGLATIVSTHVALYAARLASEAYLVAGGGVTRMDAFPKAGFEARIALLEGAFR